MEGIVFHGSPRGYLEVLKARESTHQKKCIYAADSKSVALLFMGKGMGDLDTMIATVNSQLVLVERRPGVIDRLYNKEGYLYELDGSTFDHYDFLWSKEVISFENEIVPLRKKHISNIMQAIEEEESLGNIRVFRYPDRPTNVPLDNSYLIDKYISFEKKGLTGAVKNLLKVYPEFEEEVQRRLKERSNTI